MEDQTKAWLRWAMLWIGIILFFGGILVYIYESRSDYLPSHASENFGTSESPGVVGRSSVPFTATSTPTVTEEGYIDSHGKKWLYPPGKVTIIYNSTPNQNQSTGEEQ